MSDPEASPPEAPPAAIDSAVCPQCETTLRNVVPGADGKTKCLNCGMRFAVNAALEPTPRTGSFSEDPPPTREPAGGGFVLVTVCASVLLLASAVGALAFGVFAIPEIFQYGRLEVEGCWGLLYWPGGVIFAWGLWALARSLGPLDAALVHLAWRRGKLQGSLPRPVGSNLPFILPPSVAGGVGGLMVAFAGFESEEFLVVIGGLLIAGAGMLVGLLFENLNLFLISLACPRAAPERQARQVAHQPDLRESLGHRRDAGLWWRGPVNRVLHGRPLVLVLPQQRSDPSAGPVLALVRRPRLQRHAARPCLRCRPL
ncbi:MAG: hypothetical protein AMXMBFR7_02910 [Planctomycetota bacterium]